MRTIGRSACAAALSVFAVLTLVTPAAVRPLFALTATALYLGGTRHPLSAPDDPPSYIDGYLDWAYDSFVAPSGLCTGGTAGCAQMAVRTPAEFWPITGLQSMRFDDSVAAGLTNLAACLRGADCELGGAPYTATGLRQLNETSYTIFGYSQSGTIASLMKADLITEPPGGLVSFVFAANPNRPSGGILTRFEGLHIPLLGVTFTGATLTNSPPRSPLTTVDVVHQYDPVADFPTNPLNAFALINTLIGFPYEHPEGGTGTAELQGQYQDSTYYLVPTETLPMIRPLTIVPYLGPLIATAIDPPLRVLVEAGYDRTINPGAPTPANYLYIPNLFDVAINTLKAIPAGWDNGIAHVTGDLANRPFRTTPPGPFGVGGPPVDTGAIDPYGPPTPVAPPQAPAERPDPLAQTVTAAAPQPRPAAADTAKNTVGKDHSGATSRPETHRSKPNRPPGRARG